MDVEDPYPDISLPDAASAGAPLIEGAEASLLYAAIPWQRHYRPTTEPTDTSECRS